MSSRVPRLGSLLPLKGFLRPESFMGVIYDCNLLNAFVLLLFYPLMVCILLVNWLLGYGLSGRSHQGSRHSTSIRQLHKGKSSFFASAFRFFFPGYTKGFAHCEQGSFVGWRLVNLFLRSNATLLVS